MRNELTQFVWDVPECGYQVLQVRRWLGQKANEPPQLFLTRATTSDTYSAYRYPPLLAHTGLFKTFAATNPTGENIVAFANKYGWLGAESFFIDAPAQRGERLSVWVAEIRRMSRLVELWEMAAQKDTTALRQHIVWHDRNAVQYKNAVPDLEAYAWIASAEINSDILARLTPGDLIEPAYYYLQSAINHALKGKVSPGMLWDNGRLGLYQVPSSLLGAVWLQFAQAIDTRPEYRKCLECRTWFAVSLDTSRKSRRYCSDACRAKAYRNRKQEKTS